MNATLAFALFMINPGETVQLCDLEGPGTIRHTFWYEPIPSAKLPPMPDLNARTADIWKE